MLHFATPTHPTFLNLEGAGESLPMTPKSSLLNYMLMGLKSLCLDCQQGTITDGRLDSKNIVRLVAEKLKETVV